MFQLIENIQIQRMYRIYVAIKNVNVEVFLNHIIYTSYVPKKVN
jgi:hypothetical protein